MCLKTYCDQCGLTTWQGECDDSWILKWILEEMCFFCAGCGLHIEQVLQDVPIEERCQCQKDSNSFLIQNELDSFLYSEYDWSIWIFKLFVVC